MFCTANQMTSFYMKCNTGLKWANSGLLMNYNISDIFWPAALRHPYSKQKTKRYFQEGGPLVRENNPPQVFLHSITESLPPANRHHAINDMKIVTRTSAKKQTRNYLKFKSKNYIYILKAVMHYTIVAWWVWNEKHIVTRKNVEKILI